MNNKKIKKLSRTKNIELLNKTTTNTSYASVKSSPDSFMNDVDELKFNTYSSLETQIQVEEDDIRFISRKEYEKESEEYKLADKINFSEMPLGEEPNNRNIYSRNTTNKNIEYGQYIGINDPGIYVWDQDTTGSCTAQGSCFLFLYTMAVGVNRSLKDVSWWEFANSADAPPLAQVIIDWLKEIFENLPAICPDQPKPNINYTKSFFENFEDARKRIAARHNGHPYLDTAIFSRSFMLWSSYYSTAGTVDVFPARDEGTSGGLVLKGLQVFGAVITPVAILPQRRCSRSSRSYINVNWSSYIGNGQPKLSAEDFINKFGPYNFYPLYTGDNEFSKKIYKMITDKAFQNELSLSFPLTEGEVSPTRPSLDYYTNYTDDGRYLAKDNLANIISRNIGTTLEKQKKNNFRIISIANNETTIIETLRAGYPISFGMALINYKIYGSSKEDRIPFLPNTSIMRFTDQSELLDRIEFHQVVAVGFARFFDGKIYIKARNSWSISWGQDGYFYIPISYLTRTDLINNKYPYPYASQFTTIVLNNDPFPFIPKFWFKDSNNTPRPEKIQYFRFYEEINLIDYLYLENFDKSDLTFKISSVLNLDDTASLSGSYIKIDMSNWNAQSEGGCKVTATYKNSNKNESVIFWWKLALDDNYIDDNQDLFG